MKIVYFIDHLRGDGTQRKLKYIVEGLRALGHAQAIVCLNDSYDDLLLNELRARTQVRIVGKQGLLTGEGWFKTWRWLRQERFDLAVTFLFASDVVGRTLARAARVPRIVSSLEARNINYTAWQRWLARFTMRWADVVLINHSGGREYAITEEGAPEDRIVFIPTCIPVQNFSKPITTAALCAELGLPTNRRLLGSVGRLTYQKGFDVLISALAILSDQDVNLILIGEGEDMGKLCAQAVTLHVQDRVIFAGYRQDIPRVLGAFDVYVQPSRWEGMPAAVIEAMAAGCPIVVTGVDGNLDLIEDGVHGWLVASEDPGALAAAIHVAMTDLVQAQHRAGAAQERARTQLGIEAMVKSWEQLLGQV